jgi:hypothetical protein
LCTGEEQLQNTNGIASSKSFILMSGTTNGVCWTVKPFFGAMDFPNSDKGEGGGKGVVNRVESDSFYGEGSLCEPNWTCQLDFHFGGKGQTGRTWLGLAKSRNSVARSARSTVTTIGRYTLSHA